jgi:hypothetical protein
LHFDVSQNRFDIIISETEEGGISFLLYSANIARASLSPDARNAELFDPF